MSLNNECSIDIRGQAQQVRDIRQAVNNFVDNFMYTEYRVLRAQNLCQFIHQSQRTNNKFDDVFWNELNCHSRKAYYVKTPLTTLNVFCDGFSIAEDYKESFTVTPPHRILARQVLYCEYRLTFSNALNNWKRLNTQSKYLATSTALLLYYLNI